MLVYWEEYPDISLNGTVLYTNVLIPLNYRMAFVNVEKLVIIRNSNKQAISQWKNQKKRRRNK